MRGVFQLSAIRISRTKINNVGGRGGKWHSKAKLFSAEGCSASAVLKALIWRQFAATCSTGSLAAENAFIHANGYITARTEELVWQLFRGALIQRWFATGRLVRLTRRVRRREGNATDHYFLSSPHQENIFGVYWLCLLNNFAKWPTRCIESNGWEDFHLGNEGAQLRNYFEGIYFHVLWDNFIFPFTCLTESKAILEKFAVSDKY